MRALCRRVLGTGNVISALADPTPLAGVSFEQLYLLVFLHDGQGIIMFLLFGLHPRALQAFADLDARARRALEPFVSSIEANRGRLIVGIGVTLASLAIVLLAGLIAFLAHAEDAERRAERSSNSESSAAEALR